MTIDRSADTPAPAYLVNRRSMLTGSVAATMAVTAGVASAQAAAGNLHGEEKTQQLAAIGSAEDFLGGV